MNTDQRLDAYIAKAEDFAQSILLEIRKRVHAACPDVQEDMKWSMPHFLYKGKILCNMASFKKHCSFGFWLAPIMNQEHFKQEGMGDLGKLNKLQDLPEEDLFRSFIHEAMELIDAGKTLPKAATAKPKSLSESDRLLEAIRQKPLLEEIFFKMPPSHQKEYHEWILDAKTETTVQKRLDTALEWIGEGKSRNWKYQKC